MVGDAILGNGIARSAPAGAITVTQNLSMLTKLNLFGDARLLILRNLLKTKNGLKIPAYMAHPLFQQFTSVEDSL